jgi:predicted DNA-binding transcriptional regulator AlpA
MPLVIAGLEYFTAAEVCRLVGVSRQTLWRWRQTQRIPHGSRLRAQRLVFSSEEVEQIQTYASFLEPADRRSGVQLGLFSVVSNSAK